MFFENPCELLELTDRIFSDHFPAKLHTVVYVFSETTDNQGSPIAQAASLWAKGLVQEIVCADGETDHGDSGFAFRKNLLRQLMVAETAISPLVIPLNINVNTLTEAQAIVRHVKTMSGKTLLVSAPPFHQRRAFVTTVSVALREYPELCIYNAVGTPLNWQERVRHSQGTLSATRKELTVSEYDRLLRYHAKGDLCSCKEVLQYLDARDGVI